MITKNNLWLSLKLSKKNRKSIVIVLLLSILILTIIFSFNKSLFYYIENNIKKSDDYREYFIDIYETNDSTDDAIIKLKKINHITDAFVDDEKSFILKLNGIDNKKINGEFILKGINSRDIKELLKKNVELNDNEIICPINFLPVEDLSKNHFTSKKDFINMKQYLTKNVSVTYNEYASDYLSSAEKNLDLKLVGTYKNSKTFTDENICYANYSLIRKIYNGSFHNLDLSNQYNSVMIKIDHPDNYNEIIGDIYKLGYNISNVLTLNENFVSFVKVLTYLISAIIILFVIIFIFVINRKNTEELAKNILILKSTGSSNKNIYQVFLISNVFNYLIGGLITLLIILTGFGIIKILTEIYPFIFWKTPILLDGDKLILSYIIILLIIIVENIIMIRRILHKEIMEFSDE